MTRADEMRDTFLHEQERLRTLLEASSVGHFVTDPNGRIVKANAAAARLFGLPRDHLRGKVLPVLFLDGDRTVVRAAINAAAGGEARRVSAVLDGDGTTTLQLAASPLGARDVVRWIVRDVTAQRLAGERIARVRERVADLHAGPLGNLFDDGDAIVSFALLANERDQLRTLLDRLEQGVLAIDRRLVVEVANEAARRMLGAHLVEGTKLPEPWPDQVSLAEMAAALFRRGALEAQTRVTAADDATFEVHGLPAGTGAPNAVMLITDITKRERAERVEREFVANASHELRTPLATITGAIDILQSGAKEIPEARDRFLAHIEREVGRLAKLVRALLVLARAQAQSEAPRLAPVKLRPLLDEVARSVEPNPGVEVVVACPPTLTARADEDLLLEVVGNLVGNAAAHTREGRIRLSGFAGKRATVIEVRDTGSGIDDAAQEHLFDRFYRAGGRDGARFGLGLAIVREAVAALGGEIALESEEGEGTTVRVTLPTAEAAA